MAGRCRGAAIPWRNSGRGPATRGAAERGGAAMCGIGRGAMAGRCGGGAGRNAGAAGRAIAGGDAGRAMAGGAAGRAIAGGAAGLAATAGGPGFFCAWADEPTLAAITQAPSAKAEKRTPTRSIMVAPRSLFGCPSSSTRERRNRSPSRPAPRLWRCDFATQDNGERKRSMESAAPWQVQTEKTRHARGVSYEPVSVKRARQVARRAGGSRFTCGLPLRRTTTHHRLRRDCTNQSGNPSLRRFSPIRSRTAGEKTIACLNFEIVRSG